MLLNWVENFDCPIEGGIGSYFVTAVMYPLEGVGFLLLFLGYHHDDTLGSSSGLGYQFSRKRICTSIVIIFASKLHL